MHERQTVYDELVMPLSTTRTYVRRHAARTFDRSIVMFVLGWVRVCSVDPAHLTGSIDKVVWMPCLPLRGDRRSCVDWARYDDEGAARSAISNALTRNHAVRNNAVLSPLLLLRETPFFHAARSRSGSSARVDGKFAITARKH